MFGHFVRRCNCDSFFESKQLRLKISSDGIGDGNQFGLWYFVLVILSDRNREIGCVSCSIPNSRALQPRIRWRLKAMTSLTVKKLCQIGNKLVVFFSPRSDVARLVCLNCCAYWCEFLFSRGHRLTGLDFFLWCVRQACRNSLLGIGCMQKPRPVFVVIFATVGFPCTSHSLDLRLHRANYSSSLGAQLPRLRAVW